MSTASKASQEMDKPAPPRDAAPSSGTPSHEADITDVRAEANNYATTKSVTQVIFTTSAIASNVTLWNQLDRKAAHFGALNTLIWISVALNIFVILLATYLSFQRPKPDPAAEKAATSSGGTHATTAKSAAAGETKPDIAQKPSPGAVEQKPTPDVAPAGKTGSDGVKAGTCASCLAGSRKGKHDSSKGKHDSSAVEHADGDLETGCCWVNGTHNPYYGDAVELCGIKLYSRSNAQPSWACCDVGCCALLRVVGTGKGLGMLSVNASKKRKRHFMDAKNNLLNEVIGILAVAIVIMNVIISAIAPSAK